VKPDLYGTQSYSALAYDGEYVWAVWHSFNYKVDSSQTQLLLKIDKETGQVVSEFPAPLGSPGGNARGLAWDGKNLWHGTDRRLTALNQSGNKLAQYVLPGVREINGLAWDGSSLWIIEFGGKLWKLPLK